MSAYLFVDVTITDPEGHQAYQEAVPQTLLAYGAERVVGGEALVLEGDYQPQRPIVVMFPDMDALKRWYTSTEYQAVKKLREHTARVNMIAI